MESNNNFISLHSLFKFLHEKFKEMRNPSKKDDYIEYLQQKSMNTFHIIVCVYTFLKTLISMLGGYGIHDPVTITHLIVVPYCLIKNHYKSLSAYFFLINSLIPLYFAHSEDQFIFAPAISLLFASLMIFTTRNFSSIIIYVVIQLLLINQYIEPLILVRVASLSPDQLSNTVTRSMSTAIRIGTFTCILTPMYYKASVSMLRKVNLLRIELDKKKQEIETKALLLETGIEEKRMFILTFSHEFKNALNGLLGSLRMATQSATDKETREILQNADICSIALRNFTHNLLDAGKLEENKLEVALEATSIFQFLTSAWQVFSEMIRAKRLKGFMQVSKDIPEYLLLDTQKLFQVLLNLTSNSLKFTLEGSIYFIVEWKKMEDDEKVYSSLKSSIEDGHDFANIPIVSTKKKLLSPHYLKLDFKNKSFCDSESLRITTNIKDSQGVLCISVIDTGPGIASENVNRLFQRFSQISDRAVDRKRGTGLGLWITKQLTELMNGDINVRTSVGSGSVFQIKLKTKVVSQSVIRHHLDSLEAIQSFDYTQQSEKKILIADDDYFNIDIMVRYLKKLNKKVLIARDGKELVSQFKANYQDIQAVITDNYMPNIEGKEAALIIKKYTEANNLQKIPVYLLSGDDIHLSEQELSFLGISDVLAKPIDYDQVSKLLFMTR